MSSKPTISEQIEELLVALMDDYYADWEKYYERHKLHRHIAPIESLISQSVIEARINELENFQWNDAHTHVHNRLNELRELLNGDKDGISKRD